MWTLLKSRARKHGGMFPQRDFEIVRRFGNPKKPYFIGTVSDGTMFVGDYRDLYSVLLVVDPNFWSAFIEFIQRRMTGGGVYYDVGANLGVIAAAVGRSIPNGRVVAFEPLPATAERAAAAFALNGLANARLFQVAVSDTNGEISFFHSPNHSDRALICDAVVGGTPVEIKVPCCTLDSIAEQMDIGEIGFLKLDVEGHEPAAVRGATNVISRHKPEIVYEFSRGTAAANGGWVAEDVAKITQEAGDYDCHTFDDYKGLEAFPPHDEQGRHVQHLLPALGLGVRVNSITSRAHQSTGQ